MEPHLQEITELETVYNGQYQTVLLPSLLKYGAAVAVAHHPIVHAAA
jgi:hypothetical protein